MLTIYKASAGSGKTYTLAYEYIKLLLGVRLDDGRYVLNHTHYLGGATLQRPHARILAITFTNKATAEMKDRIIGKLRALTVMPEPDGRDADYAADLTACFGCTRSQLRDVAERALRNLLNDYGSFNVSTIDAFFQTILRSFAREIDRQGDFRLELDERTVVSQAVSLLFDEINLDPDSPAVKPVARWLDRMAAARMRDGKDFNPFNRGSSMYRDLVARLLQSFSEEFVARQKDMDHYLSDPSRLNRLVQWLDDTVKAIDDNDYSSALAISAILAKNDPIANLKKHIDSITDARGIRGEALRKLAKPAKYQQALLDGVTDGLFKKGGRRPDDADAAALAAAYASIVDNAYTRCVYAEILAKTDSLYAFNYIFRYIDRYRRDNNLIVLADTNSLLGAIISESDTPFIYERVGVDLQNFLIDEFQDTSRMQWHNLRPLLSNSLSAENDNLIIGDVKQSIYRFRGGDPSLLGSQVASRDFPHSHSIRGDRPGENTNYRSSHEVVCFNNSLFTRIAADCRVPGYEGAAQSLGRSMDGVPGYVSVRRFTDDSLDAGLARFFTDDEAAALADSSPRHICYTLMARDIRRQLADGYRPDEIAILCRSNSEASDIAEFLMASYPDIHIVSDEALKICNSHAVKLIISVLEIIDKSYGGRERPDTGILADSSLIDTPVAGGLATGPEPPSPADEARARRHANRRRRAMLVDSFEYYMARGRDVGDALRLALDSSAEAMARLTSLPDPDRTPSPLFDDLDRIRRIAPSNLAALVEAIIDLKIPHDERARQLPYIAAFVDIVEAYTRDFVPSVHSFLSYWHDRKHEFSISSGSSAGAVTVITVHKAKGLEWPCVHIPAVSWPLEAAVSSMWFDLAPMTAIPADIRPPLMQLTPGEAFRRPQCPLAPQYLAAQADNTADNLNVAYVAFTRAVRELHISFVSDVSPRTRSLLHISDAVAAAIAAPLQQAHTGIYADLAAGLDPDGNYTLGEPTRPLRSDIAADCTDTVPPPVFDVSFNPLNRQLTRLADMTVADDIAGDPDIGSNAPRDIVDEPVNTTMEQAARRGLVLHSILQRMYTVDDLDRAVEYHRPYVGESYQLDECRQLLRRAFSIGGPHPQRWFAPANSRVLAEQTIYHRPSGLFRRADRIVWTDPGVVEVIDYKFTSAPRPAHYVQIRDYAAMLATMDIGTIRAFLWYPLLNRVIEVDIR